jgi:hypothetical protein
MGKATAEALHGLGYKVAAWSRTEKSHEVGACAAALVEVVWATARHVMM